MVVCIPLISNSLQVIEADLQKKINNVQELCAQAKNNLSDFCSQKKQLEDFLSKMTEWLETMEGSLLDTASGSPPEEIGRVKVQKRCNSSCYSPLNLTTVVSSSM